MNRDSEAEDGFILSVPEPLRIRAQVFWIRSEFATP